MKDKLEYSFDDEPVSKFCYDASNKKIEIHFTGYYDLLKENSFIDRPCTFVIANWKEGKSKSGDESKLYDMNHHIGIFSMILFMKMRGDELELFVRTIDNRYITFFLKEPELTLL